MKTTNHSLEMVPPKKGATKAAEGKTSTGRPNKKSATKVAAPKLTARQKATKASAGNSAAAAKQTTQQTPTNKAQKAAATAKAAGETPPSKKAQRQAAIAKATGTPSTKATPTPSGQRPLQGETPPSTKVRQTAKATGTAATQPKIAPLDRPTLPGEMPPGGKAQRPQAVTKATGTAAPKLTRAPPAGSKEPGKTPQQRANTSRKRKSSSIEEEEEEEVEPVATRTASKKIKTGSGNSKRKATADASRRPQKLARIDEQENQGAGPSTKKTASSRAKTPASRASASAEKRGRKPAASKVRKAPKTPAAKLHTGIQINFAPTQPLDVFIFGSGESGELGLGNKKVDGKKPVNVKRPRIHPHLSAENVGVVQIACGGMHSVALTKDNRILTWGVNDQGALGRDTTWDGGLRDADAENDADDGDDFEALNPIECTPAEVSTRNIVNDAKFVKVVASDSASFALTEDGRVYGWGTFRVS